MTVCFSYDDFISDKDASIWIAELSDGTTVYQDDDRPGLSEPRAWLRLRSYLYSNNLNIARILIKFRSHTEVVGSSDFGYFFRRGVKCYYGGRNIPRYVFGLLNAENKFDVQAWNLPELLLDETDVRDNIGYDESLILVRK